jgi:hypothetical protein
LVASGNGVIREIVEWQVLLVDVQLMLGRGPQERRQVQLAVPERDRRRVTGCGDAGAATEDYRRRLGAAGQ